MITSLFEINNGFLGIFRRNIMSNESQSDHFVSEPKLYK